MSGNKKIVILLAAGILLTACKTIILPDAYNFTYRERQINPYGCWMNATLFPGKDPSLAPIVKGELIWMNSDSICMLEKDHVVRWISTGWVKEAQLVTHKNMSNVYGNATAFLLIPNAVGTAINFNDYGGDFLAIAIPLAVVGLSTAFIEIASQRNILKFPKKTVLEDFQKFARFPADKPLNIDFKDLTFKKYKIKTPRRHKNGN